MVLSCFQGSTTRNKPVVDRHDKTGPVVLARIGRPMLGDNLMEEIVKAMPLHVAHGRCLGNHTPAKPLVLAFGEGFEVAFRVRFVPTCSRAFLRNVGSCSGYPTERSY